MRRMAVMMAVAVTSVVLVSCGGKGGTGDAGAASGDERTVLVDFRHDEFAGAFLQYYPENLKIRAGDTIQFRQAWTGEPHSVTFGKIVDQFVADFPSLEKYDSPDAALADGVPKETVDKVVESYVKLPAMVQGYATSKEGAEPCFIDDLADAPVIRDVRTDVVDVTVPCPDKGRKQPPFTGRQALYNSGFIPYSGPRGNSFTMPIAKDATPGTYRYFCNYHFIFMGGSVEVVAPDAPVPSQSDVAKQARKEIEADGAKALKKVREARALDAGQTIHVTTQGPEGPGASDIKLPLAGRATDDDTPVIINEFFPKAVTAKVGQKVTWTFDGAAHTVSFNVPKYFPIFRVDAKSGTVTGIRSPTIRSGSTSPNKKRPARTRARHRWRSTPGSGTASEASTPPAPSTPETASRSPSPKRGPIRSPACCTPRWSARSRCRLDERRYDAAMRRMIVTVATLAVTVLMAGACGSGSGGSGSGASGDGQDRTVLIDYKHDQFASSFLHYYPEKVTVRPGDKVTFRQSWTGEPHSVTLGKVVDDAFEVAPLVENYDNEEEARAGGVDEATIARAVATFSKLPSMTNQGFEIYQPGAQPCFVAAYDDLPNVSDAGENQDPKVSCPTKGKPQPAFTGRQALYNSGFIPYQGAKGNTFELPIADDATPGTYRFFCNYHFFDMHGTVEVVAKGASIPSADAVRRQGQKEIARDVKPALGPVQAAQAGSYGDAKPPLVGLDSSKEHDLVAIDGFFPSTVTAQVGKPVTWTAAGWTHTVSFNVPKYFPIFTVAKSGVVRWDPKSYEAVAWKAPPLPPGSGPDSPPTPRFIDVGKWDGGGGFHSSGILVPGDTFTVTFTRPGTYPFACVLHPAMVGKVTVRP